MTIVNVRMYLCLSLKIIHNNSHHLWPAFKCNILTLSMHFPKFDSTSVQSAEKDLGKSVTVLNRKMEAKSLEEYWEDLDGYCSGTELIHLTQDAVKQKTRGKLSQM